MAASLAEELSAQLGGRIGEVETQASDFIGIFDVYWGDELIYSKQKQTGRLPHPGEVEKILLERLANQ